MDAPDGHRRFRVFRFKRGDGRDGRFDEFVVPVGPRTTVLDALLWIQLHRDRSLALRHSCLHASCGTCGVLVNGREALACVTPAADAGEPVTVEPLANVPVLTDLVVDLGEFYARFPDPHPTLRTSELTPAGEAPRGAADPARFEDCLECALCLSACPIAATSSRYAGPAALSGAQRLLEEPRGADVRSVLDWADGPEGAWRCHAAYECTEVCPADARPAERIMALRGELLRGRRRNGRSLVHPPAARKLPGATERALRGPVRRKGVGPATGAWLDPRGRRLGGRAFALNRVTGIALVLYLYLHLGVLSVLLVGASAWDGLVGVATSAPFLVLDVVLMFGLLFHGLNGLRVALVGSGVVAARHRALFWAAAAIGTAALAVGAFELLGGA